MLRRLSHAAAAVFFSATLAVSTLAQPEYLALISDLEGAVEVAKAGQSNAAPAVWGMQLFPGDRVMTTAGSEVSILFSNNSIVVLGPKRSVTISADLATPDKSNVKTIVEDLYGTLAGLTRPNPEEGRGRALAGLRAGADDERIQLISPRNTKLKTSRPSFVWRAEQEQYEYEVKLYDASGLVWQRHVVGNHLEYPEDEAPLNCGWSYFWQVEGSTLLGVGSSGKAEFSVLSEQDLARVASKESMFETVLSGETGGTSYRLALGAYYVREGLYESAIASFTEIAKSHPKAVLPREILGRLYNEIGLKDLAIDELLEAVALSH